MLSEVPHNLFARWRAGDTQAINDLLPLIHDESRQVARKHLRGQRADHARARLATKRQGGLRVTLSEAEDAAALALHISAATVKGDWTMAGTWLRSELRSSAP